jgi:DNA modification methylase
MTSITNKENTKLRGKEEQLIARFGIVEGELAYSTLDVNETIKELAYLTHSFFRYYGKFPSKLASHFLAKYASANSILLDNYVGSGTSLVEASLLGLPSYGIDINPLAVLASNVKTYRYDLKSLRKDWSNLLEEIDRLKHSPDFNIETHLPSWNSLDKWFSADAQLELAIIRAAISDSDFSSKENYHFFILGFSSIVRRVSRAYDGEVRPHINPKKSSRSPISAFVKKVTEMISLAEAFSLTVKQPTSSRTFLDTNLNIKNNTEIAKANINLVLSHPPYLNCFDYIPVFSLELAWMEGVKDFWQGLTLKDIKSMESRSWPATNESILYGYFEDLMKSYKQVYEIMAPGGICGIVIGDSTIRGELIRVHRIVANIAKEIGYEIVEIIYRSTHYGTGKYAYSHRADYHDNGRSGKKDGIIVLRKPAN